MKHQPKTKPEAASESDKSDDHFTEYLAIGVLYVASLFFMIIGLMIASEKSNSWSSQVIYYSGAFVFFLLCVYCCIRVYQENTRKQKNEDEVEP